MTVDVVPNEIPIPSGALIIAGERVSMTESGVREQLDPATGRPIAEITLAGPAEVEAAVESARDAQREWRRLASARRRDLIMELADLIDREAVELSALRSLELGAPMKRGKGLNLAVEYIRYFAGWVDKLEGSTIPLEPGSTLDYTIPEPYGTVAALTPFNGGLVSVAMKVVPALAAGNTVVLKPSELATLAPLRFGELCLEAGMPSGVVNVIPGGIDSGKALVAHPGVDKISFTGGTNTARQVLTAAAQNLTPVVLELGGKSANVVFADADLEAAIATTVGTALAGMSGQGCVLPTRLLVQDEVYDEVEQMVDAAARAVVVGRPFDDGVQAGPVITEEACDRIVGFVDEAARRGDGRLLTGGGRIGGDLADGYFVEPTVFGDVDNRSPLAQEEIFGPVLSLVRFASEEEAVHLANETAYGLGGLVFTRDLGRAHRMAHELEAGYVGLNAFPPMPPGTPFGGVKQSGFGREGGLEGVREFLRTKNVYVGLGSSRG
jgi:aldehyde dehydrogenase (NAD+)